MSTFAPKACQSQVLESPDASIHRLRILHILDHSLPLHSGYAFRTASILREQRALGWETFHLTSPKQGKVAAAYEEADGWGFHRTLEPEQKGGLPGLGEFKLMGALTRRLEQVVKEVRPNVLHAHSPVLNALPALKVGRKFGIPVVYEVRAFWEDAAVDHGTTTEGSLRYRLTRAMETYALKRVQHVTTICEGLRQDIAARGIPADRITVIPNAVDATAFAVGGSPDGGLAMQLGLAGKTVLGFVGSFYAYEGLDLLIDALAQLAPLSSDLRVLLVGGGPQETSLKAQARALGLEECVVFTGRVPHDQVQRYYDLIDVLVYPRRPMRLTELVTPLKPLEAMAQGRLLVASDVGGHNELVRDGETGVLFRAGEVTALVDAVNRLLLQPQRGPAMRANGRRFVESERTWACSVARYADVYSRLPAPIGSYAAV